MKISHDLKNLTTTQTEMARILDITQPRVSQLIQNEIVIKDKTGAVLVVESLKNFYKSKLGTEDDEEINFMIEKAKHEKTKREIAELKLAKMQGKVYDSRTVELVLTEMLSNLRTQLLGLPSKLAPQVEMKKKEDIYEFMTKEIEEKLSELSEYSPELFTSEDIEESDDEDSD
ncbi:hypothetical protein [Pectinatus frisingensis]|uniref:hypothetical protein n=1 Tax=Pectinatus frisingensis TaxID=865 RepID=UPI0018C707FD|nr:hypothetical protein [Pectinatus frisingensis]